MTRTECPFADSCKMEKKNDRIKLEMQGLCEE